MRISAAVILVTLAMPLPAAAAEPVLAGAAGAVIDLPRGVPLAGYSRREGKPSEGVHDPVEVRAVVLRQGDTQAALVSADLLIIDEYLRAAVIERLGRGPAAGTALLLAATHTHSGPGAYGRRFLEKISMGHYEPEVFERIVEAVAHTVEAAAANLRPAGVRSAEVALENAVENRMREGGDADPAVRAAAFYALNEPDAPPMAVVFSFGAHPTVLGAENRLVSADYPGAARRRIESALNTRALFFAGAVGDQKPVKRGEGFAAVEDLGERVGMTAIEALRGAGGGPVESLAVAELNMPLPKARVRLSGRKLPQWLSARLVDDDATITVIGAGPVVWFGVPCDMTAALGDRLMAAALADGRFPIVAGFANDYMGYCVTPEDYTAESYESGMAFNGPDAGTLIVDAAVNLLDRMP